LLCSWHVHRNGMGHFSSQPLLRVWAFEFNLGMRLECDAGILPLQ
jgi:hypothetical protein